MQLRTQMSNLKFKQYFLTPMCLRCSSWLIEEHLFCSFCYEHEIESRIFENTESQHIFSRRHIFLINWLRGESDELNQLVYRLKGTNSVSAVEYYSVLLAQKLRMQFKPDPDYAIVPIPSAQSASKHAHIMAEKISKYLNLKLCDVLQKQGVEQKHLKAEQRKLNSPFSLKTSCSVEFTKFIFIDDVVTTGQSFKHCSEALGNNKQNIMASLFYRPKVQANEKLI